MSNTKIWDALAKTNPEHTKGFKRAGGFSGTAVKPIYCDQRMTEQFGPCGEGWGINEPQFQLVPAGSELLVFCTVSIWHGKRENVVYGVGGDKVVTVGNNGPRTSDEAFKMAFTDAIGKAMKHLGMSADIHMGLFDDAKYVRDVKEEFSKEKATEPRNQEKPDFWSRDTYALTGKDANDFSDKLCQGLDKAPDERRLTKLWEDNEGHIKALPDALYTRCQEAMTKRMAFFAQAPGKAA